MMDNFLEESVGRHNRGLQTAIYILANITMVICGAFAVLMLSRLMSGFQWPFLVIFAATAGIAVLLFLFKDRLKPEYEYSFTNGDLDFAAIYNNKSRKNLGTMKVANVEAFGPVNSESFRKMINLPELKTRNWFLNRQANLYYFYFQKEGVKNMIIFEPSREMTELIRKYLPRGAYRE